MKTLYKILIIFFVVLKSIYSEAQINQISEITTETNKKIVKKSINYNYLIGKQYSAIINNESLDSGQFAYYAGTYPGGLIFYQNKIRPIINDSDYGEGNYDIKNIEETDTSIILSAFNPHLNSEGNIIIKFYKEDPNIISFKIDRVLNEINSEISSFDTYYYIKKSELDSVFVINPDYQNPKYKDSEYGDPYLYNTKYFKKFFLIKSDININNIYRVSAQCNIIYYSDYRNSLIIDSDKLLYPQEPIKSIEVLNDKPFTVINALNQYEQINEALIKVILLDGSSGYVLESNIKPF